MLNISCFYKLLIIKGLQKSSMSQRGVGHTNRHSPTIMLISIILLLNCSTLCQAEVTDQDFARSLIPWIIAAESSGNPRASDGHSYGLCGISPSVLEDYNKYNKQFCQPGFAPNYKIKDLFDPKVNTEICEWYLERIISFWLPEKYNRSAPHVIYAYNSGISKLRKLNWQIPSWTKNHPNRIYRAIYRGEK